MIMGTRVKLRGKALANARNDYEWAKDSELTQLDAASVLTASFSQYLSDYESELRYPISLSKRFAIEALDGEHIGNCSCYNIDKTKSEAELGIMIGNRDYRDKGYGVDAVTTLVNYMFHHENLDRIYLKTLTSNVRAQRCFRKCGFTVYGCLDRDGYHFTLMELQRHQYGKQQGN